MDYAGLKFNPADGGPAPPELTDVIQVCVGMPSMCLFATRTLPQYSRFALTLAYLQAVSRMIYRRRPTHT